MKKAKELLYPVGIESLYLAMMTGGTDSRDEIPKYEVEIYQMDNVVSIGIAGNPTTVVKWASNKMFVNASKNSKFILSLAHVAFPQEVQDKIDGILAKKGVAFGTSGGKLQGAGEAGPEAVLPLNPETLGAIGKGIAETMGRAQITINSRDDAESIARAVDRVQRRQAFKMG